MSIYYYVDQKRRSCKVAVSIYYYVDHKRRSCKVAVFIYHVWIAKKEVLRLRCLYIMCGSLKKKF